MRNISSARIYDESLIPPLHPFAGKPLKEFIFPFSDENLKKILHISGFFSSFFPSIACFAHDNFEIRVLVEAADDSSFIIVDRTTGMELFTPEQVELLFVQWMAVYHTVRELGIDFIDFSTFRVSHDSNIIRFPVRFTTGKTPPLKQLLHVFLENSHLKDLGLTEKNSRDIYQRLSSGFISRLSDTYIYRYTDFASSILNSYPISELKENSHLKIRINPGEPIRETIIRTHIYNSYCTGDTFLIDIRESCGRILPLIIESLPEPPEQLPAPDDYVSFISHLSSYLEKSSYRSVIILIGNLSTQEDAKFIDFLLETKRTDNTGFHPNIMVICFGTSGPFYDFDLELIEKPVNYIQQFLAPGKTGEIAPQTTSHERGSTELRECFFPDRDTLDIRLLLNTVLEGRELLTVKEIILQHPFYPQSPVLKLIIAYIYRWEREYIPMKELLGEIGKTGKIPDDPPEIRDTYYYLLFILAEKESHTRLADKHLSQVKEKFFIHCAAMQLSDRYIYRGDLKKARLLLEDAANYFAGEGKTCNEIAIQSQIAKLSRENHELEKAETLYRNLFIKSDLKNAPLISADIAVDLGNLYFIRADYNQAETWYRKSLKIFHWFENKTGINLVRSNLVEIENFNGNWQESKNILEEVLDYDTRRKATALIPFDYYNIAHLEFLKHNFTTALDFISRAFSAFEKAAIFIYQVECELLRMKIHCLSGQVDRINSDFLKTHRSRLTADQEISLSILETVVRRAIPFQNQGKNNHGFPAHIETLNDNTFQYEAIMRGINAIESRSTRYELILVLLPYFPYEELLELLRSSSLPLARGKKNYYYYEYYYVYYNYFFKREQWNGDNLAPGEAGRFYEIYYFFLKNQRRLSSAIIHHKQVLEEKESRYDIFESAEMVGDYMQWKFPEDFFFSLTTQLKQLFKPGLEMVKLVIFENSRDILFSFSTTAKFEDLTGEMISAALHKLEHLNLDIDEVRKMNRFRSNEKAFYFYKNTKVLLWKMSESLLGVLLIAFSTDEHFDYPVFERHDEWFKKFGNLVHRYYEYDYKLNRQLEFIIGESPVMKRLKEQILKVGKVDFSLLILGESGSGKELVAKAVHLVSSRSAGPFIPVNAAAIPENLLEAELFGYKKGAFTGATESKKGLIEAADGGTLFLDEIADLPINLQAKLLRVLQESEIRRIGENITHSVNIRLISATNKNLRGLILTNQFREDLFFRIQDLTIDVPSLRERIEDIPLLVRHFLNKYGFSSLEEQEFFYITQYFLGKEWTGNIRELESSVKRFITYYPDYDMKNRKSVDFAWGSGLIDARENLEKSLILQALTLKKWNRTETASLLKISRQYLFDLMNKYGIRKEG